MDVNDTLRCITREQIMMHSIVRIILCLGLMALVACAGNNLSIKQANDLATCKMDCQHRLKICSKICHNNCGDCAKAVNCHVVRHYHQYKNEQCVQGGIIARELNSYRDPLQCRKLTCDCSADYSVCTQSCSGLIHKRLQVPSACC